MKKFSKDQIREIAADVFGRYPRANSVAVTDDGQAFITDDGDAAVRNHARVNRYKEQLEITCFNRSEFDKKQEEKPKNDSPKVATPPKAAKLEAKKAVAKKVPLAKEEVKAENPPADPAAKQNESEQPKKEE